MGGGESHDFLKMNKTARNDARNGSTSSLDSFNYPYPRTHTTMMVIPSRRPYAPEDDPAVNSFTSSFPNPSINFITSMSSENGNSYVRPRPPLNRSCPPIPESRSNESIMTHASSAIESLPTPSSTVADKCVIIGNPMATHCGIPKSVSQQSIKSAKNPLQSPSTSAAPSSMNNNNNNNNNGTGRLTGQQVRFAPRPPVKRQHVEPPRSPLMSVAHSVRNSLSKLGNRLSSSRGESPQKEAGKEPTNIKNSRSMSSMPASKNNSKSKLPKLVTDQNDNLRAVHKSSSMEAPPRSASSDSLKQIIATKRGERVTKPSSLPLPRYPSSSSSTRFPVRNLDTIISEVSEEVSRMESIKCEKLKKTREADEVPTPPSYDLKDLVSRFVDDSTLATAEIRQGSWANVVEPDEVTVAEEIPMDTNPTPDDVTTINDDDEEEVDDIKEEVLIGDDSITVVREEHCTRRAAPPIFIAPAPPRLSPAEEQMLLNVEEQGHDEQPRSSGESSDSTVKENCNIIYIRKMDENGVQRVETIPSRRDSSKIKKERERERKELEKMQKKEKEKEKEREKEWLKEKEKEKEKGQRTPLSTRSIKQFLLRRPSEKTRDKKTPPMSRSMMAISPTPPPRGRLALPFHHHPRFAPLVEMESSVVENSPAVEIAPGKWGKPSPKILRRNSECSVHDLIKEAGRHEALLALRGDDNGNITVSPRMATVEEPKGLIDDEILDQPMLMGDSFPTSESLHRLSQQGDVSQMGIDLSPIDRTESRHSHQSRSEHSQHSQHFTQPSPSNPQEKHQTF
ncbi:hypothetical protein PENTCL1PPCAC_16741 [Pristionchus entomophagus]|uniref:Uncharacterized protein n=1 Tax=Pristionchus entomophagus TaxID=358040 RepID=A0AAV5TJS6_9BILA|nr:hypothetical protein PENTCL1PPCAC_16741 [Pristionchus entomophagus]